MKGFCSLTQARKSLAIQVTVLTGIILLLCIAVRLKKGNYYDTFLILSEREEDWNTSELVLEWDRDNVPVRDYSVEVEKERDARATLIHLSMQPDRPGEYELTVRDPSGKELARDSFHVGRFLTAFSERTGNFTGDEGLFLAALLFYSGLAVLMLLFFLRLRESLIYSYEAIFSFGVFIFSLVTLILEIPVYIRHLISPGLYQTWMFLDDIASGGKYFAVITFPLVAVFSLLLIISNIELLRHEPPRVQNILGLILGIAMTGGDLFFLTGGVRFLLSSANYRFVLMAENIVGVVFAYLECILFSSVVCGLRAAKHVPKPDRDFILILGCGFRKDGSLPPLIRGRVDKAMEFWRRQKEETGKEAVIIPSGGQGKSEPMAEAEAMYRYMISTGFPASCVIREDQSANTFQNMQFSKKIIESRAAAPAVANVAFATTNYHVFRSGIWAGLADLKAEGIGSRTKWWFCPNAFVRECIALLKNRLITEILFLVILVGVFGFFTWLALL